MGPRKEVQLKNSVNELLDEMTGKLFLYNGDQVRVLRWSPMGDRVNLVTDKWDMKIDFGDVKERAKEFLPVDEEETLPAVTGNNMPAPIAPALIDSTTIAKLRDVLMDNIEKVKADKNYIPQAQEVKAQVDSVIDLAKTEIEMMKTIHIISGRK